MDLDYVKTMGHKRKDFGIFRAKYYPMWIKQDFGEEFGEALENHEDIPQSLLTQFNDEIRSFPLKRRSDASRSPDHNWVKEYDPFYEVD